MNKCSQLLNKTDYFTIHLSVQSLPVIQQILASMWKMLKNHIFKHSKALNYGFGRKFFSNFTPAINERRRLIVKGIKQIRKKSDYKFFP